MALRVLGQLSSTAPRRPESRRRPQRKPPERRPLAAATHREGSASHHLQDVQFGFFCKKPAGASASRAGAGCGGAGKALGGSGRLDLTARKPGLTSTWP